MQIYQGNAMNSSSAILKAVPWRVLCCAAAVVTWGCSGPRPPQPSAAAAPPPPVSYDGHYQGTVRLAATASGTDPQTCAVDPPFALDVRNNAFVYVQAHPEIAGTAPGLTAQKTTVTYNGSIAPDGTISGSSAAYGGTIAGQVSSAHMSGQISGVLCKYTFSADRV
jgi:hypothetical protein